MRLILMVAAVILVVLAPTACGSEDSPPTSLEPVDGPPASDDPIVATPPEVEPGELIELTFPTNLHRGAPWYISMWDGDDWTEPLYLVIASADGYNVDGPDWSPRSEAETWAWEDIGLGGPGPDTVVVPDVAGPGAYRLCTANTGDATYCVNITVVSGG